MKAKNQISLSLVSFRFTFSLYLNQYHSFQFIVPCEIVNVFFFNFLPSLSRIT